MVFGASRVGSSGTSDAPAPAGFLRLRVRLRFGFAVVSSEDCSVTASGGAEAGAVTT